MADNLVTATNTSGDGLADGPSYLDQYLDGDFFDELGLDDMSSEARDELSASAVRTIENRVLLRIADQLDDAQRAELTQLSEVGDGEAFEKWVDEHGVNLGDLVVEESLAYRLEMAAAAEQIKTALAGAPPTPEAATPETPTMPELPRTPSAVADGLVVPIRVE